MEQKPVTKLAANQTFQGCCTLTLKSVYPLKKWLRAHKKYNEAVTNCSKTAEVRRKNNSSDIKYSKLVDQPPQCFLDGFMFFHIEAVMF